MARPIRQPGTGDEIPRCPECDARKGRPGDTPRVCWHCRSGYSRWLREVWAPQLEEMRRDGTAS